MRKHNYATKLFNSARIFKMLLFLLLNKDHRLPERYTTLCEIAFLIDPINPLERYAFKLASFSSNHDLVSSNSQLSHSGGTQPSWQPPVTHNYRTVAVPNRPGSPSDTRLSPCRTDHAFPLCSARGACSRACNSRRRSISCTLRQKH